jgi:hypothetical protein
LTSTSLGLSNIILSVGAHIVLIETHSNLKISE